MVNKQWLLFSYSKGYWVLFLINTLCAPPISFRTVPTGTGCLVMMPFNSPEARIFARKKRDAMFKALLIRLQNKLRVFFSYEHIPEIAMCLQNFERLQTANFDVSDSQNLGTWFARCLQFEACKAYATDISEFFEAPVEDDATRNLEIWLEAHERYIRLLQLAIAALELCIQLACTFDIPMSLAERAIFSDRLDYLRQQLANC